MSFEKEDIGVKSRILLIFSSCSCVRRRLCEEQAKRDRLVLTAEDTGFSEDLIIPLEWSGEHWQVEGKELRENYPFYFDTKKNYNALKYLGGKIDEKLLLLLSGEINGLGGGGRLVPGQGEKVVIGNAYKNQVFYKCFSFVGEVCAEILWVDGQFMINRLGNKGVYVNGKTFGESARLKCGDSVDIYGLHILVLKGILVCVSFCGICRIAMSRDMPEWREDISGMAAPQEGKERKWIERRCGQEKALHGGEVEVVLPEKPGVERREPLFFSLGPMLTMVLPVLLMAQLSGRFMEGAGKSFYYMSVVMSVSSAFLALFWGLANHGYRERTKKRENRDRERQYVEYLDGLETYLQRSMEENRMILEERYPPLSGYMGEGDDMVAVSWNRYYRQKDFLYLRVGKGKIPFQIRLKLSNTQKSIVQGKLAQKAGELIEKYDFLEKAPVEMDFYESRQVGITGIEAGKILIQILMQTMACHCYTEVKTACFYREERTEDQEIVKCLRWMPHSWSEDRKVRFLAGSEREAAAILPTLTKEITKGGELSKGERRVPWYFVVLLEEELILGEPLYKYLTDPEEKYPVSVVFLGKEREDIPKSCRYFIRTEGKEGEILSLKMEQAFRQKLAVETCNSLKAQRYVRKAAGFRVRETESGGQMPEQVSFLQLYGCGRVEELKSERRWKYARCEERLKVPIGCRALGNVVSLDLHEKFHGPHGLIAGTTGSGKSELLQTYLLSMAVSFSPLDVNFFMIDYKGGGTGNALRGLPHCAGVISNLSGNQIKRAMSAITSENKQRQRLLSRFQVNHIDAYTRLYREGYGDEPMPHLILVVDEFAELKKEEPEFMQEIISLAQVGRSLGVHLILATQKPAGTVDEKIWSNARCRLCLRVQDRQDSMDMLHNGDAAFLTSPGQCYLQIGNHEYYELFQAGYCGGNYVEEGEIRTRASLIQNTGRRIEMPEKTGADVPDCRSQIDVLVSYVARTAANMGYGKAKALWLPELPEKVLLKELMELIDGNKSLEVNFQTLTQWQYCKGSLRYARGIKTEIEEKKKDGTAPSGKETGDDTKDGIKLILGLCDDPGNQRQEVLTYEPHTQGHLAVCGGPATGKSTLLKTILWQLATYDTEQETLFLAVDIGQESLSCFGAMPGCLMVFRKKEEKDIFFYHLERLVSERQKLLSGINIMQYNKTEKRRLAQVFLVIDNFGNFYKILEEKQEEFFMKLISQGISLGFYLILSASGAGEIGGRIFEKIKTTLALEMSDRFQYGDVLRQYYLPVVPKENQKGRGLCRGKGGVLEFQGALAFQGEDYAYAKVVEETGREREGYLHRRGEALPEKFPTIPKKAKYGKVVKSFSWKRGEIPLGYCLASGEICSVSTEKPACFLISGEERTGRGTLMRCLIESVLYQNNKAVVLDTGRRFKDLQEREGLIVLADDEEIDKWQFDFAGKKEGPISVFISDLGGFCRFLYSSGQMREERIAFWEKAAMGKGKITFLAGIYHPTRDYEAAGTGFFSEFVRWQQGIHLGGNVTAQRALDFDDLSYAKQNQHEPAGIGYLKEGMGKETMRVLLPEFTCEEDEKIS